MKRVHPLRSVPWLLVVLTLLFALPLRAQTLCVAKNGEGIGGTGRASSSKGSGEGIGGSGRAPRIGGEGIGGTGVFGTITGFGSICVNGLEIDVDQARVDIDGRAAAASDLALGHLVAVEARERAGGLSAERISVSSAVAGPLSRVDAQAGSLELLGQRVLADGLATLWDAPRRRSLMLSDLRDGDFVRISGLRRSDGVVVATRVERTAPDVPRVTGPVELRDDGSARIGSLRVDGEDLRISLVSGQVVTMAGPFANGALKPTLLRVEPEIPFEGRLRRLSLEGFVQDAGAGRFRVANLDVDASSFDASGAPIARDARIRVLGSLSDLADLLPEAIEVQTPEARSMRWSPLPAARPLRGAPSSDIEPAPMPSKDRMNGSEANRGPRPDRADSLERPDVPERPERPERTERPQPPERPQRPERPERPDRPDRR